jgi:hypothetical protein
MVDSPMFHPPRGESTIYFAHEILAKKEIILTLDTVVSSLTSQWAVIFTSMMTSTTWATKDGSNAKFGLFVRDTEEYQGRERTFYAGLNCWGKWRHPEVIKFLKVSRVPWVY